MLKNMFFTALLLALPAVMLSCDDSSQGGSHNDSPICGNGVVDSGEECDGQDMGSLTCESLGYAGGTLTCTTSCTLDLSGCQGYCGDGRIQGTEECDGDDMGGMTCMDLGFERGRLGCKDDCSFDVSQCVMGCGNGIREPGEECDGEDLGDASCENLGYSTGTLSCTPYCTLDVSQCEAAPETCGNGVLDASEICDGTPEPVGDLDGQCHDCTWAEYYYDWGVEGLTPETQILHSDLSEDGTLVVLSQSVQATRAMVFDHEFNKIQEIVFDYDHIPAGIIRWIGIYGRHLMFIQEETTGSAPDLFHLSWARVKLYSIDLDTGTMDGSQILLGDDAYVCGGDNSYIYGHVYVYRQADMLYLTYLHDSQHACAYEENDHRGIVKFDPATRTVEYVNDTFDIELNASLPWQIIGVTEDSVIFLGPNSTDKEKIQICTLTEPPQCLSDTTRNWLTQSRRVRRAVITYARDYGYVLAAFTLQDDTSPMIDVYDINMGYYGSIEPFRNLPGSGSAVIESILLKDGILYVAATVDGDLGSSSFGGKDVMIFRFTWPTLERQIALRFGTDGDDSAVRVFPTSYGTAVLGHGTGFFSGEHYLYVEHPFLWMSTK